MKTLTQLITCLALVAVTSSGIAQSAVNICNGGDRCRRTLYRYPLHIMLYAAYATHFFAATRTARVTVPDFQLSLAIGREGQNARLAARLTGWRIDIRPDTEAADEESGATDVPTPAAAE